VPDVAPGWIEYGENDINTGVPYAIGNPGPYSPPREGYSGMYGSCGINDWVGNPAKATNQNAFNNPNNGRERYWATPSVPGASNVPLFLGALWLGGTPLNIDEDTNGTGLPPSSAFTYRDVVGQGTTGRLYGMCRFLVTRHRGENQNALFVDFSARSVGVKELWSLKWHKEFDIRNGLTLAGGVTRADWVRECGDSEWMANFKDY
jgi:hypothetical protein